MKDKLIAFLCESDTWKHFIYSISAGGVVVSYFTDPKLQGIILAAGIFLGKPVSVGIAKLILRLVPDWASTETKLDDIAYAMATGIVEATKLKRELTK